MNEGKHLQTSNRFSLTVGTNTLSGEPELELLRILAETAAQAVEGRFGGKLPRLEIKIVSGAEMKELVGSQVPGAFEIWRSRLLVEDGQAREAVKVWGGILKQDSRTNLIPRKSSLGQASLLIMPAHEMIHARQFGQPGLLREWADNQQRYLCGFNEANAVLALRQIFPDYLSRLGLEGEGVSDHLEGAYAGLTALWQELGELGADTSGVNQAEQIVEGVRLGGWQGAFDKFLEGFVGGAPLNGGTGGLISQIKGAFADTYDSAEKQLILVPHLTQARRLEIQEELREEGRRLGQEARASLMELKQSNPTQTKPITQREL